jgi:hypothetical protein
VSVAGSWKNKLEGKIMTNRIVFHGEYWVYLLAAASIILVASLLYTLDGPIRISRWFM